MNDTGFPVNSDVQISASLQSVTANDTTVREPTAKHNDSTGVAAVTNWTTVETATYDI